MKKRILFILLLSLGIFVQAFAQNRVVTGTVTGKDDGLTIPGATIRVKGTTTGVASDAAGHYRISVPPGEVLEFSAIGYLPLQVAVQGDVLNVTLATASGALDEVVVTANDIKRDKRTLGYSAPIVNNKELTEGGSPSALTSLTGLVAGVNITSTSNTPGSSTRIVLRGGSSITGNNQALLVVDGVPIDNSSIIGGASSLSAVDFGNRGNDIDPNDIASITVLKGPAAAALYGSRASNGALMITTKSGAKNGNKLEITLNSSSTFSSVLKLPTFQNEYGQGYMSGSATSPGYVTGINDASDNFSWGAPFTGQIEPWGQSINGVTQKKPYSALPDNIKDFFKTGFAANNNLSFASGNDKNNFYLALSSLNSDGVFPASDTYDKYGVRFNGKATLANNFTASVNFNYNKISSNTPSGGQNANGIWNQLMQTPRDIPINTMGDLNNPYNGYNTATGTYGYYGAFTINPYYILQNFSNLDAVNRITGNVSLAWKPAQWLNIVERIGADSYADRRQLISPKYTFQPADDSGSGLWGEVSNNGSYEIDQYNVNEVVHDLMVTATHNFGKDFHVSLLLGNNIRERSTTSLLTSTNTAGGLVVPGWYNLENSNGPVNIGLDNITLQRLVGFYTDLNLSYKEFLFLEGTLRNDRSSTLPINHYSYYYPSASGSFVFSELLKDYIPNFLSYGKLRASVAQVGSDTNPYALATTYGSTTVNGTFGSTVFPFGSVPAAQIGRVLGNNALEPEQTTSFEIGTELAFLQSRLSFDFSYYVNDSKNQILAIPIPYSTGYQFSNVNAGEIQNKGIELTVRATPVRTTDFSWDLFGTYTKNNSDVVSLPNGVSQVVLGGFGGMGIVAAKGLPYGEFYAITNQTDAQGRTIVSQTTGQPVLTTSPQYLGSYEPKFQTSFGTNLKYKNLTLNVLFDVKHGGVLYSDTKALMDFVGTSTETAGPRYGQPFPNSVYLDASGKSIPNTTVPYSVYDYYVSIIPPGMNVIDASYIKMRSANITYTFSKTQLQKLPFGAVSIGLYGNNLLVWTPKSNSYVDPEVNSSGANNEQGFDFAANPSVRNYGINLKVSF